MRLFPQALQQLQQQQQQQHQQVQQFINSNSSQSFLVSHLNSSTWTSGSNPSPPFGSLLGPSPSSSNQTHSLSAQQFMNKSVSFHTNSIYLAMFTYIIPEVSGATESAFIRMTGRSIYSFSCNAVSLLMDCSSCQGCLFLEGS